MVKQRVLITGGAGYIGSVLTELLLAWTEHDIVVYDNLLHRQESIAALCYNPRLNFVHGDVRDTNKLSKHLNADVIIPLAAIVGAPACERDKTLATQVIYDQIVYIVEHTSRNQKIILPNTNSGYGIGTDGVCTEDSPLKPVSHYGVEKVRAEQVLLENRAGVSLRLATVFGVSPRMRVDLLVNDFTYKALHDGYIVLFEKDFKRNFIHVRDVCRAFMFMMNYYPAGEVFNVGLSSANLSKFELCQAIKKYVPHFSIQVDEFAKDPDQRNYIVSNAKIESTGWQPHYSLEDGIQELIKAYQVLMHSNRKFTNL